MVPGIITIASFACVGALNSEILARTRWLTAVEVLVIALLYFGALSVSLAAWLVWSILR